MSDKDPFSVEPEISLPNPQQLSQQFQRGLGSGGGGGGQRPPQQMQLQPPSPKNLNGSSGGRYYGQQQQRSGSDVVTVKYPLQTGQQVGRA